MLIRTLLYTNTLPQSYRKVEEFVNFDDFLSEIDDRKESEEDKKRFQNKCVSSQNHRMKKEEGAMVDCRPFCHPPSLSGPCVSLVRPDRQRSSMEFSKPSGKPH